MKADWLKDAAKAGVFQLSADGRELAGAAAAQYGRGQDKPFWTLIGGPDGWKSGWPDMPSG